MEGRTCGILALLALVGLAAVCICGVVVVAVTGASVGLSDQARVTETISTELPVVQPASLTINNRVGDISISAGDTDVIQVQATKEARSFMRLWAQDTLDSIDVRAEGSGNTARITVDVPNGLRLRSARVDFEIVVPQSMDLDIVNNVGDISVLGTTGSLRLRSNVGDIALSNVTVREEYDVEADVGDIDFEGQLPEDAGTTLLRTRVGEITVALSQESRFMLDAETSVGVITTEFDVQDREADQDGPSQTLKGFVNTDANDVQVVLRTDTGDIDVERGP